MTRERATELLAEMLRRLVMGGRWLDLVDEVYVFGSYARGALEPGDVDVAIEYTADKEAGDHFARALTTGADWHAPFRQALRGRRRGLQLVFDMAERLRREPGFELTLIYVRGDSLAQALARLHAIPEDPHAGRSDRDAMLPEIEGLDEHLPLPLRKALVELIDAGAVEIERLELPAREPSHPRVLRIADMRWRTRNSAARRAACAALAQLESEGIDLLSVRIGDDALGDRPPTHSVGWTLQRLNLLPQWLRDGHGQWLQVVNPSRSKPLIALRFTNPIPDRLAEGRWSLLS